MTFFAFADVYFLINWTEESHFIDVVHSKCVVPPNSVHILDVVPGMLCKVAHSGQYFQAKVIAVGELKQ